MRSYLGASPPEQKLEFCITWPFYFVDMPQTNSYKSTQLANTQGIIFELVIHRICWWIRIFVCWVIFRAFVVVCWLFQN